MAFLYQLTSPSGRSYVGVTTRSVEERWSQHSKVAAAGSGFAVHRAIRKYGADSFEVRTLAQVEGSEMFELEKRAIQALGTKAPLGYNLTNGGDGVPGITRVLSNEAALGRKRGPRSAAVRAKISASRKGQSLSPQTRAKIAEAHSGRCLSPDHKAKISASLKRHFQGV